MIFDEEDRAYFLKKYQRTGDPRYIMQMLGDNPEASETRLKYNTCKIQLDVLNQQIKELQKNCAHPREVVLVENKSNTGNYDPTADCYWKEMHCLACDKRWSEDQ